MKNTQGPLIVTNDFTFNSSSTIASALSDDFTVGTFRLTAGLFSAGTVTIEITNAGGWVRNGGTFTPAATTTVLLSGTVDQQIGGTVATTFTKLELSNTGTTGVTLNQDMTVSGVLTFTEGELVTSSTNILTMAAGSSVASVSDDSFVHGPMEKIGSTPFTFPVGKDFIYRPITISALSASGTFRAEYFHADPSSATYNTGLRDAALKHVSNGEYWNLNVTSGTPSARVTLSWNTYSGTVNDLTNLRIARWNGSTWKEHLNGGTSGSVSPGTGTIITPAGSPVSAFGPFTLASANTNNPLPIVLLDFKATLVDREVYVSWTTASEINNDYFILEKTRDAKTFTEVTRVKGAGTSKETHAYSYIDEKPYAGISYYRLTQVDYDGKTSFSKLIVVDNRGGSETPTLDVFPNPTAGSEINVIVKGISNTQEVTFELMDLSGRQIDSHLERSGSDGEVASTFNTDSLSQGVYLVSVHAGDIFERIKVVVN
jgi:hypothetical protein